MTAKNITGFRLSDRDLNFLIEAAAPDVGDKSKLKKIIRFWLFFLKFNLNTKHQTTKHRKSFIIETFFKEVA
jgi:hypothetical protein